MPSSPDSSSPQHIARLDVVRACAFLSVYFYHFTGFFSHLHVPWRGLYLDYSVWPGELLFFVPVAFGWLGVPLFFVLSGFCIHFATMRRKTAFTIGDFYWRRFLRIYPAYIVCVFVVTALTPWLPTRYFNSWQVVAHVLMIHNFIKATFFGLNGVFWSLAVEMQFYLLYPLVLYAARCLMSLQRCLALALVLNVLLQIYLSLTCDTFAPVRTTWSFPLVTWCDWILGACLAEAFIKKEKLFIRDGAWLVFSALMMIAALNFRTLNVQIYLFSSVFFAVLMQRYLAVKAPLHLLERGLIPVGLISYSLYLWHSPILILLNQGIVRQHLFTTQLPHLFFDLLVGSALVFPISWASHALLEVRLPAAIRDFAARWRTTPAKS